MRGTGRSRLEVLAAWHLDGCRMALLRLQLKRSIVPTGWQLAIDGTLRHILPQAYDYSVITHPAIDQEIEQAMKEHIGLRLAVWAVFMGCLW